MMIRLFRQELQADQVSVPGRLFRCEIHLARSSANSGVSETHLTNSISSRSLFFASGYNRVVDYGSGVWLMYAGI
jgi:hypothetical protein